MSFVLRVQEGSSPPTMYRVDDPCTLHIGRLLSADISLDNRAISRQHCSIDYRDGCLVATDTHSRNGTYINIERRSGPTVLSPGDHLRLADARIDVLDLSDLSITSGEIETSPLLAARYLTAQGGNRKLRLVACAWFRHLLGPPLHDLDKQLLELAERLASGSEEACNLLQQRDRLLTPSVLPHAEVPAALCESNARQAIDSILHTTHSMIECDGVASLMCRIACDVLGHFFHPFRPDEQWRRWHEDTVGRIAKRINATGDFTAMPILADALEDAGCEDEVVLRHCRESALHVRGCWVVEGLLMDTCSKKSSEQNASNLTYTYG